MKKIFISFVFLSTITTALLCANWDLLDQSTWKSSPVDCLAYEAHRATLLSLHVLRNILLAPSVASHQFLHDNSPNLNNVNAHCTLHPNIFEPVGGLGGAGLQSCTNFGSWHKKSRYAQLGVECVGLPLYWLILFKGSKKLYKKLWLTKKDSEGATSKETIPEQEDDAAHCY